MSSEPEFRFCTSADGVRIAYMTYGSGPPLVYVSVFWSTMGARLTNPDYRIYVDALAASMRLVTFDRRGTGDSERNPDDVSPEAEARDIGAVADAAGLGNFSLCADADGLAGTAEYASAHGERVERLVVWASWFDQASTNAAWVASMRNDWSYARRVWAGIVYPQGPVAAQREFGRRTKDAVSGEMAARRFEAFRGVNFAKLLPAVTTPTLVLARENAAARQNAMNVARMFPSAEVRFVPGDDVTPMTNSSAIVSAIEQFVGAGDGTRDTADFVGIETASPDAIRPASGTAVILFTDIVESTAITERLGDVGFRDLARALDTALRSAIRDCGGALVEGKTLGDGVLATFGSAAQAIEAARRCLALSAASELGLHIGLHAGDVIREDGNVYGGAVNIASRICGLCAPGEILVSSTVRDLARTSAGVLFEDRGQHEMKGVGEPVRVYAVVGG